MSSVRVVALEPVNQYRPGEDFDATEREAVKMMERGLVRLAVPVQNKAVIPQENKANPFEAAGEDQPSSASQAVQASPETTVIESAPGRRRGRPRKSESSS